MRLVIFYFLIFSSTAYADAFGTGFFVSSQGHVITNAHVIEGAVKLLVRTKSGIQHEAKILAVDNSNDLALLKIDSQSKALHIRSTEGLEKGARVFTVGFPNPYLQGIEPKYTDGVISSFSGLRNKPSVMQISVPIQPGNSGGPLVDAEGNVIGIIVSKLNALTVLAKQEYIPENVNFAIKSDYALPLIINIPSNDRSLKRKTYAVSEIEESTVLIISSNGAVSGATEDSKNFPKLHQPPVTNVPSRRTTILAPESIENGCIVPIGFTVMPSLVAGDFATIKIDGVPAVTIAVNSGALREFQYRIRISRASTLEVDCPRCKGESFSFKALFLPCAEERKHSEIGQIRIKTEGDTFRSLIDGSYPSADFLVTNSESSIRISSSPSTALNPFIMVKFDGSIVGRMCLNVSTPFGKKESCN